MLMDKVKTILEAIFAICCMVGASIVVACITIDIFGEIGILITLLGFIGIIISSIIPKIRK